jgi:hypothetical protein
MRSGELLGWGGVGRRRFDFGFHGSDLYLYRVVLNKGYELELQENSWEFQSINILLIYFLFTS